jgi:hypothetical protein
MRELFNRLLYSSVFVGGRRIVGREGKFWVDNLYSYKEKAVNDVWQKIFSCLFITENTDLLSNSEFYVRIKLCKFFCHWISLPLILRCPIVFDNYVPI